MKTRNAPWFTAFEQPGRTGQVAIQRAGSVGCPCKSIEPCPCGRPPYNYEGERLDCV